MLFNIGQCKTVENIRDDPLGNQGENELFFNLE